MKKVPVVFLSADHTRTLRLDEDLRKTKGKVRTARYRDVWHFDVCLAARVDDIAPALDETKPTIVHFSGHGTREGLLLLGEDGRTPIRVSADDLKKLFTAFRDEIRVVVLSACSTSEHAKAIAEVVDCAIGTSANIRDAAAIDFNAQFYRALACGASVKAAYDKACAVLAAKDLDEVRPELEVRPGVDPAQLFLIPPPSPVLRLVAMSAALLVVSLGIALAAAQVRGEPDEIGPSDSPVVAAVDLDSSSSAAEDLTAALEHYRMGNYTASFPLFKRAAEEGIPEAMGFLGIAYFRGEGTDRSPDRAAHWLTLAAHEQDAQGMNAYGLAYEEGFGVARSYEEARRWYKAATEKHYVEAMRNLARLHREGRGAAPNDSLALYWYLKAVDANSVEAIVDVGLMYAEGVHGRRDMDQALSWLQRAADQGSGRAMHAIGRLHEDAQDYGLARVWYQTAARAGSADAMNRLGVLYQRGWGGPPDRAMAARWYRQAARAGSRVAAGNLSALEGG